MNKYVLAIASSQMVAESIFTSLRESGFAERDISLVAAATTSTDPVAVTADDAVAANQAGAGAAAGGVMGGAIAVMAGVGLLAIPGVGPFIAAGPILAALGGVAVGASLGGIAGALVSIDLPEVDAKFYETRLRAGNVMVAVHPVDAAAFKRAKKVLSSAGATDIRTVGEPTSVVGAEVHHTAQ